MSDVRRPKRVARVIHSELVRLLAEKIEDPALQRLRVNEVDLSSDLKVARVFLGSVDSAGVPEDALRRLERARGFIRRQLSDALNLKVLPELRFVCDTHEVGVQRIMGIFSEIEQSSGKL